MNETWMKLEELNICFSIQFPPPGIWGFPISQSDDSVYKLAVSFEAIFFVCKYFVDSNVLISA